MIKVIQLLIIVLLFSYPGLSEANDNYKTFSKVDPSIPLISEIDYLNFLRISIIDQPEYLYSVSTVKEKDMSVRFAERSRLPDLSMRIINDSFCNT